MTSDQIQYGLKSLKPDYLFHNAKEGYFCLVWLRTRICQIYVRPGAYLTNHDAFFMSLYSGVKHFVKINKNK